jgi:hypothetical protein
MHIPVISQEYAPRTIFMPEYWFLAKYGSSRTEKLSCCKIYPHHDIDIVFSFKSIQNFVPLKKSSPKSPS